MAITKNDLEAALKQKGLKHHFIDDKAAVLLMGGGPTDLKLVFQIQEDGEYLDLRTVQWATCLRGAPAFHAIMNLLAEANYKYRIAKFGWDPDDGEIAVRACLPIEKNQRLSPAQVYDMVGFLSAISATVWPDVDKLLKKGGNGGKPDADNPPQPASTPAASPEGGNSAPSTAPTPAVPVQNPSGGGINPVQVILALAALIIAVAVLVWVLNNS